MHDAAAARPSSFSTRRCRVTRGVKGVRLKIGSGLRFGKALDAGAVAAEAFGLFVHRSGVGGLKAALGTPPLKADETRGGPFVNS